MFNKKKKMFFFLHLHWDWDKLKLISIQQRHIKILKKIISLQPKWILKYEEKKRIYSIQEFSGSTIHRDHELNAYSTIVYSVEVLLMKSLTIMMKITNNYGVLRMKILNISTIFLVKSGWKMKNENWKLNNWFHQFS